MSSDDYSTEADARVMCCASCGITEVDDIKLMECDGCDLVRYCSDACQQEHRSQHEAKCKERAAELREELLFRQPESTHLGDCPICCLPLSLSPEEADRNLMKRVGANDPVALTQMGKARSKEGDYDNAFKYYTKAAELGDAEAHFNLSIMYMEGQGVEKDEEKELYHLEEASIAGHPLARCNLGCYETRSGRIERAAKHFSIAANLGHDGSLNALKEFYKEGDISKDDFAAALRGHYAAVKATKSPQREAAAKYFAEVDEMC